MIDRERYELAALAANIKLVWPTHEAMPPRRADNFSLWHPDDAQSGVHFELVVELDMNLIHLFEPRRAVAAIYRAPCGKRKRSERVELADYDHDVMAASRAAVFLAAVECGKQMKAKAKEEA